jgi:CRP-like cAMP-binding protein
MSDNIVRLPPKTVIFREGEEASKLYLIKSGEVLCLKASKERLIPVFAAKNQDIIGESAMLSGAPYTYSAIALETVELIMIPNRDFRQVLDVAPQWLVDLTLTMVSRFQSTSGLVAENRILHASILGEEEFPPSLEIEYRKLLSGQ